MNRTTFLKRRRRQCLLSLPAATIILMLTATWTLAESVRDISLDTNYLTTGGKSAGVINLDAGGGAMPGARLRITEFRQIDIGSGADAKVGGASRVILEKPLADVGAGPVQFEVDSAGILSGRIRVSAEIIVKGSVAASSIAWADPIVVGTRERVSLAGTWEVTKVEPYEYANPNRPKEWKVPVLKTVTLPGVLFNDDWLRGWVTVRRKVEWAAPAGLRPRVLRMSEVSDSAQVTIDGVALPESRPVEEMAVLTHWNEYHSQFKGEENAKTRLLFMDLLPGTPVNQVLPAPLAEKGIATVDIRVRGTSSMFRGRTMPGIRGDLHLDVVPSTFLKNVSFDTDRSGENRRFKFSLSFANESGNEFRGTIRTFYGRYDGKIAYTGNCPAYASADQPVRLKAGDNSVEVIREEKPRFDTCRATFVLLDDGGKVVDSDGINFHTVMFDIRDRRDFYLNNERFIVKAQGSNGETPHRRFQLRVMGGNSFRGPTDPNLINLYQSEGLLTSAGGALLASVEKCTFYNPKDTSNITKAVKGYTTALSDCPGVIMWEATNEMHGDPEEARVAIQEAFHKLDPYHRPVLATKGSGEWEAEAHDGRVKGVDVIGCQYLLSKEGIDSITAAVTEQPVMSTEVNWNDGSFQRDGMWQYWLDKGIAGSLLFDYSGVALDQPVPAVPPDDTDNQVRGLIHRSNRDLYQDLITTAVKQADGSVIVKFGNQMPYALHDVTIRAKDLGQFKLPDLAPGAAASVTLSISQSPSLREAAVLRAEYTTHGGLPHIAILTPVVTALPEKGASK